MTVYLCQYSKTCAVYQGRKENGMTSLTIYKNVFCNRGYNGWKNCQRYYEYQDHLTPKNK